MKRFTPNLLSAALTCASAESMAAADLIISNAKVLETFFAGKSVYRAKATSNVTQAL